MCEQLGPRVGSHDPVGRLTPNLLEQGWVFYSCRLIRHELRDQIRGFADGRIRCAELVEELPVLRVDRGREGRRGEGREGKRKGRGRGEGREGKRKGGRGNEARARKQERERESVCVCVCV